MKIKCKSCGNDDEFITQPNSYEIHKVIDGKLQYQKNEIIDDEFKLYCRKCSEEFIPDELPQTKCTSTS